MYDERAADRTFLEKKFNRKSLLAGENMRAMSAGDNIVLRQPRSIIRISAMQPEFRTAT